MDSLSHLQVAAALGDLAVQMHAQPDAEATLRTIVGAAVDIVPGISWAGVSLVRGRRVIPQAPTDDVARALDTLQSEVGEGPTIDALAQQHTVWITDLSAETRWPRFTDAAVTRGVKCMAVFRLFVRREGLGALTLYGPDANSLDEEAILHAEILAQHAAVAMAGAQAEEQMQRAIASRDTIGQAKGIIMERFRVGPVRAFEMLTRLSQESNVKLLEVANRVVDTTEFDTD